MAPADLFQEISQAKARADALRHFLARVLSGHCDMTEAEAIAYATAERDKLLGDLIRFSRISNLQD